MAGIKRKEIIMMTTFILAGKYICEADGMSSATPTPSGAAAITTVTAVSPTTSTNT